MITVKQTGLPPTGAHWSMGERYMREVSKVSAEKVLAGLALPRMGYETDAMAQPDGYGGWHRLSVQNISGTYWLACCTLQVDAWPTVFGVTVKG